jgi:hypothetical protein
MDGLGPRMFLPGSLEGMVNERLRGLGGAGHCLVK